MSAAPACPKTKLSNHKGCPNGSRADDVHCPWLEVLRNRMRQVASSSCFAEVDIDAFKLKLQVRIALVADYLTKTWLQNNSRTDRPGRGQNATHQYDVVIVVIVVVGSLMLLVSGVQGSLMLLVSGAEWSLELVLCDVCLTCVVL